MIEKTFEKSYPLPVSPQILGRLAKRFIKEYTETVSTYIPPEVASAVEKIKAGEEVEYYEDSYSSNKMHSTERGYRTYDNAMYQTEEHFSATIETDEYGDPVYCVSWYFFSVNKYEKRIGDKVIKATDYTEMIRKGYEARGKYRYFCTHRPPTSGCIPRGFISYETYLDGSKEIGEVTYDVKPPEDELQKWGLVFDDRYEKERNAFVEVAK